MSAPLASFVLFLVQAQGVSMASSAPAHPFAHTLKSFKTASGSSLKLFSLPALAKTHPGLTRLPVSIRIVLESVL
ncbi:hypothetical protein RZS08_59135, partial [Arthrospira platensis SPKY1]|nr:hypothetical protein [Arthrospira platensis SPKY1]